MSLSKVIFVGDPHLDNRTPLSRIDDYGELTLRKLKRILDIAKTQGVYKVIFLGDMFDKDNYDQPLSYINRVIEVFKEYSDKGVEAYSIIGNHDMKHNKLEYFQNSPLNILFQTGYVKHLTKLEIGDAILYGLDFTKLDTLPNIVSGLNKEKTNILVQHYAVDNTIPNESTHRKDLQDFKLVVAGHDHNYYPYETPNPGEPVVLRPGSMIRRTRDAYNLERTPIVYLVDLKVSGFSIEAIPISGQKAEEIFKTNVFIPIDEQKSSSISTLFSEQYFRKETLELKEMVETLPLPVTPETKEDILNYIKEQGL